MSEAMRWISLAASLFSLCAALFSLWFTLRVNKRLRRRNLDLFVEKVTLTRRTQVYEEEILRLRKLLKAKEKNGETEC